MLMLPQHIIFFAICLKKVKGEQFQDSKTAHKTAENNCQLSIREGVNIQKI
jgi:hypothetical protein